MYTIDMTGTGEYINDPTDARDCAPPRDDGWIDEYVKLYVDNELRRVSWTERQKKSQALRAKLG